MAQPFSDTHHQQLADQAVQLVADWVKAAQNIPADPAAEKLAGVLKDPNGLEFTVGTCCNVEIRYAIRMDEPLI